MLGKRIPGGYQLIAELGSQGNYIQTSRAKYAKAEVVVKLHSTFVQGERDLWTGSDLRDRVDRLCPYFDSLVAMPPTPGVAPWLRYHNLHRQRCFIICRRYYPERAIDRFRPEQEVPDPLPGLDLVTAFQSLASGLDYLSDRLGGHYYPAITPNNIFMDGEQAVLADYGLEELHDIIEQSYDGPRPVRVSPYDWLKFGSGRVETVLSWLAAVYFHVRTGHPLLTSRGWEAKNRLEQQQEIAENYVKLRDGEIDLSELSNPGERAAIAQALGLNPDRQFSSCLEFAIGPLGIAALR
ncbi:hypothetical protein [Pseudanabaena sp. PCC 6802]|uniref:hypothetical protein n=1 Tax=Pseudanabaena sp. PCC 6802 TaxID=118173 RepID=UPI00034618A1|nr:hypothetical protein [Pseudanabaena sp. PCC 6802]